MGVSSVTPLAGQSAILSRTSRRYSRGLIFNRRQVSKMETMAAMAPSGFVCKVRKSSRTKGISSVILITLANTWEQRLNAVGQTNLIAGGERNKSGSAVAQPTR